MTEKDFKILMRAKQQIEREAALRSFIWIGLVFAAVLRMLEVDIEILIRVMFSIILIALVLSSDLLVNIGTISKKDLVKVIERHIHSDPEVLTRYSATRQDN